MSSLATTWLLVWTVNNIGVTLLNKAAFATVHFHYPYCLSAIHMLCNYIGSQLIFDSLRRYNNKSKAAPANHASSSSSSTDNTTSNTISSSTSDSNSIITSNTNWIVQILGQDLQQRQTLDAKGRQYIVAFSVIFSLNIAIGNVSLSYVSVNFNQVMRSLVPALTIAMGMCLGQKFSTKRQMAVVPVMIGVAMATFGDMTFTTLGFVYTVACICLAALKVVASGQLVTGATGASLKLHPVDLLGHMAPLALVQCAFLSAVTGEWTDIYRRWNTDLGPSSPAGWYPLAVVLTSGLLSFSLNICSLQANKLTSPLTLCIAANVKQVIMMGLSTVLFQTPISPLNGTGILVVLAGSARYSYVSVLEKQASSKMMTPKNTNDLEQAPPQHEEMVPLASTVATVATRR